MRRGLFKWGAALATAVLSLSVMASPVAAQTAEPDLTCPFTDGIIVDLGSPMIRSDLTVSDAETGPVAVAIPEGYYDIYLRSYDPHDSTSPQSQSNEQWRLSDVSMASGATPGFLSGTIDDLPDNVDFLSQQVNANVSVPELTQLWATHTAYPTSGDPETYANSIHPVCAAFVPVPQTGSITVTKEAGNTEQTFSFTLDPDPNTAGIQEIASGGQATWSDLEAGVYDLSEAVPSGWNLAGISCGDASVQVSESGVQIELAAREDVTCTFTNEQIPPDSVSVSVDPGSCAWDGQASSTPVTVTIDPASGATVTISGPGGPYLASGGGAVFDLAPGSYTWDAVAADGFVLAGSASGSFTAGDCEPPPPGSITIAKVSLVHTGTFGFVSDTLGSFELTTTATASPASQTFTDLEAGTYDVAEGALGEGWTLQSAACSDGSEPGAIELAAGEVVTCTFTNLYTEVEATTVTNPGTTSETLPFTGGSSAGTGGVGVALLLLGGLVLLVARPERKRVDG